MRRLCLILVTIQGAAAAAPKVQHLPEQPRTGESVLITFKSAESQSPDGIRLEYQIVEPGSYIALNDVGFRTQWTPLPMNDRGEEGDVGSGDGIFSARLPGALQKHRRLVRYRIRTGDRLLAPAEDDTCPNVAYFVYDGVPPWTAAINPNSNDPRLCERITFGTNVMSSVPVYHVISKKSSVENITWFEQAEFGDEAARRQYKYTCTFVADDGKVYDHVRFRARGGQWRYAMGKNMWKFDFPRGHHLRARDNYGQPYRAKWEKLNLGACIQQASSRHRGEQGMFEAVGFRLFNLVGVEAPRTHWVHLRIIKDADENGPSQYDGDFWGLYLATEDMDDSFLKEHQLPEGDLYKMDFGRPRLHTEPRAGSNPAAIRQFLTGIRRSTDDWWRKNVDMPRYYSYRSIVECIHHYDVYAGKNYFFFYNPESTLWSVLPWDLDLSWADNMHGTGQEPFYAAGILFRLPFNTEYQNRLREIRDLLFIPEQMDRLIDEYAAFIGSPSGELSFVDADRAKWDYHPIMASQYVTSKARQGEFYKISPTGNFHGMVQIMKNYVRRRGQWVDETLLANGSLPPTPRITAEQPLENSKRELRLNAQLPARNGSPLSIAWRLAEVTLDSPPFKAPGKYEITPLWQTNGPSTVTIPVANLKPGAYRVRAVSQDQNGVRSHWSPPIEFSVK